jgi:mRNA interferase MazF
MRRGDIVIAALDPAVGREQGKVRPVVIVSNDAAVITAETGDGTVTIVPITSNVRRVHPFQVFAGKAETGLPRDGKIQCEQLRTISVRRISARVGRLQHETLGAVDEALRVHLDL